MMIAKATNECEKPLSILISLHLNHWKRIEVNDTTNPQIYLYFLLKISADEITVQNISYSSAKVRKVGNFALDID